MSGRLKRFDTLDRSGPTPSPSLPYLWHLMHCALVKTSLPFTASPFRPSFSVRNVNSSSYLYFEATGASPVTFGRTASLGNVCTNHLDQKPSSFFQSPSSADRKSVV